MAVKCLGKKRGIWYAAGGRNEEKKSLSFDLCLARSVVYKTGISAPFYQGLKLLIRYMDHTQWFCLALDISKLEFMFGGGGENK